MANSDWITPRISAPALFSYVYPFVNPEHKSELIKFLQIIFFHFKFFIIFKNSTDYIPN